MLAAVGTAFMFLAAYGFFAWQTSMPLIGMLLGAGAVLVVAQLVKTLRAIPALPPREKSELMVPRNSEVIESTHAQ